MLSTPPLSSFFFFNDTATTEIYTLSLHDALPISNRNDDDGRFRLDRTTQVEHDVVGPSLDPFHQPQEDRKSTRLNSSHSQISYAVFCLKKKKKQKNRINRLRSRMNVLTLRGPHAT